MGETADLPGWIGALTFSIARVVAGLAMVPHGLRATFGMFAGSGRVQGFGQTSAMLDKGGFRPGWLFALVLAATHFVAGPALALGLFTRPAAAVCAIMLLCAAYDRWRNGGYFANTGGFEFPLIWAALALVFLGSGGGPYALDAVWR